MQNVEMCDPVGACVYECVLWVGEEGMNDGEEELFFFFPFFSNVLS